VEREAENTAEIELQVSNTQIIQKAEREKTPSQSAISTGKKREPGQPPKNQILPETVKGSQDICQSL
jgi:hypothetical protein